MLNDWETVAMVFGDGWVLRVGIRGMEVVNEY